MGLFGKLFGSPQTSTEEVFRKYANDLLSQIDTPITDANLLKAIVFITFVQIAQFNRLNISGAREVIDSLVSKAKEAAKPYKARVSDLASDEDELNSILSDFPSELKIDSRTTLNGLAAFEALYFANAQSVVPDLTRRVDDGLYLAIVVSRRVRGNDSFKDVLALNQVALNLLKMSEDILRSLK